MRQLGIRRFGSKAKSIPHLLGATSGSARGAAVIATGSAVSIAAAAISAPILTRLYSPTDFGVFSVLSAMSLALGAVAPLRYDLAVHLATSDDDARALVRLGLLCSLVTGALFFSIAYGFEGVAGQESGLGTWLLIAPVYVVIVGCYQVLNQWALRNQRYLASARRNALNGSLGSSGQILIGLLVTGPFGLILGAMSGQLAGAATLVRKSGLRERPARHSMRVNARRYVRFPLLFAPAGLVSASSAYAPLLIVALEFGTASAGWFGLAQRIIGLPVMLFGQAVGAVYLSRFANARRLGSGREKQIFFAATKVLLAGGAALGAIVFLAGPWAFDVVFGSEWQTSGLVARALSIGLVAQFVVSPLGATLMVFERGRINLVWEASRFVLTCSPLVLLWAAGADLLVCIWAYSIMLALCYIWWWELSRRTIRRFSAL